MCHGEELNLKQVARLLDVHYMTAYRYVRAGRLPARRAGTAWVVTAEDLAAFQGEELAEHGHDGDRGCVVAVDWADRLRPHLLASDEAGAWSVVESALTGGWSPEDVLLDIVGPALGGCGPEDGPAAGALAATTAQRISAVLASRFRRRGRRRGTVVLGAPPGELHAVATTLLADLLRLRNVAVLELGANAPVAAFVDAATKADRLVAVAVSVTTVENLAGATAVVAAIGQLDPDIPVLLGGQAVRNPEVSSTTGASGWAPGGAEMLELVEALLPAVRPRRTSPAVAVGSASQQ